MKTTHPPPTVNRYNGIVQLEGRTIRLTPRELEVLLELAVAFPGYVSSAGSAGVKWVVAGMREKGLPIEGRKGWGYHLTIPFDVEPKEKRQRRAL